MPRDAPASRCGSGSLDDEDRVSERVLEAARAGAPWFVDRGTAELHAPSPGVVIRIGAIHPKRRARVAAVAGHGAIDGQLDRPPLEADDAVAAILGGFVQHVEAQLACV